MAEREKVKVFLVPIGSGSDRVFREEIVMDGESPVTSREAENFSETLEQWQENMESAPHIERVIVTPYAISSTNNRKDAVVTENYLVYSVFYTLRVKKGVPFF